jgi:hypothetical protein
MTPEEMRYEFDLRADKVSSKNAMNLPLAAKVAYLNRGQVSLILNRYSGRNASRTGFEQSQLRTEDLQVLVVPEEELKVRRIQQDLYSSDLTATKQRFLIRLRQFAYGSKDCKKGERITLKSTQIDDLEEALSDSFRKPDFRWREALVVTANNELRIYTDGFSIDKVIMDYLRYPRNIDIAGYVHFNNTASADVLCELPEYLHDAVVQEAVANLKADLGDPAYQTAVYKLAKTE